jgi:hypothetical protein
MCLGSYHPNGPFPKANHACRSSGAEIQSCPVPVAIRPSVLGRGEQAIAILELTASPLLLGTYGTLTFFAICIWDSDYQRLLSAGVSPLPLSFRWLGYAESYILPEDLGLPRIHGTVESFGTEPIDSL